MIKEIKRKPKHEKVSVKEWDNFEEFPWDEMSNGNPRNPWYAVLAGEILQEKWVDIDFSSYHKGLKGKISADSYDSPFESTRRANVESAVNWLAQHEKYGLQTCMYKSALYGYQIPIDGRGSVYGQLVRQDKWLVIISIYKGRLVTEQDIDTVDMFFTSLAQELETNIRIEFNKKDEPVFVSLERRGYQKREGISSTFELVKYL